MWWIIAAAIVIGVIVAFLAELAREGQHEIFRKNSEGKYSTGQRILQGILITIVATILAWAAWHCCREMRW